MTLPHGIKPSRTVWMILSDPPPRPACSESDKTWQEWLLYLHQSGEKLVRYRESGRHTPRRKKTLVFKQINHCLDCEHGGAFQQQMESEGRCQPYTGATNPPKPKAQSHFVSLHLPPDLRSKCKERGAEWVAKVIAQAE